MRANGVAVYSYDAFSRTMMWQFPKTSLADLVFVVPAIGGFNADSGDVGATMDAALLNGFKQKIADAMAMGQSATVAEKRDAAATVIDRLIAGVWNEKAGAKPRIIDVDALVAAIAAITGKNTVGVREYVEAKNEETRKSLAESEKFAKAYVMAVADKRKTRQLSDAEQAELDAIPD